MENQQEERKPRYFAVAYALKGVSFIAEADELSAEKPKITRMKDDPGSIPTRDLGKKKRKGDFLREIRPGDVVYMDNGGAADRFALTVIAHGGIVRRIPGFRLPPARVEETLLAADWLPGVERPFGKETGEVLTARKARAMALWVTARNSPHLYDEVEERDLSLLQLKLAYRSYDRMKRGVLRAVQGLMAGYNDFSLLELALGRQKSARQTGEDIHSSVIEKIARDLLGGETPVEVIKDFVAQVGSEFPGGFPEQPRSEDIEKLVDFLFSTDKFHAVALERLNAAEKRIEKLLTGGKLTLGEEKTVIPANIVYEKVFSQIPGMGSGTISARIISAIGDIRRFRSRPALTAYAGYHHFADGSRARRVCGKVSNWHQVLKQGIWLWTQGTVKLPFIKEDGVKVANPWRQKLDARKAYELYKILRARQQEAMEQDLDYDILPGRFATMPVAKSVMAFQPTDYAILAAHVDELRKKAGVTGADEDEGEEDDATVSKVKDPVLAKLVAGVKMSASQKAARWLGQQILVHIYKEWNRALHREAPDVAEDPVEFVPDAGNRDEALAP